MWKDMQNSLARIQFFNKDNLTASFRLRGSRSWYFTYGFSNSVNIAHEPLTHNSDSRFFYFSGSSFKQSRFHLGIYKKTEMLQTYRWLVNWRATWNISWIRFISGIRHKKSPEKMFGKGRPIQKVTGDGTNLLSITFKVDNQLSQVAKLNETLGASRNLTHSMHSL